MSELRESIIEKINKSKDYPTFILSSAEVEWIVTNWLETHSKKQVLAVESDTYGIEAYNGGYYLEVEMSDEKIIQRS